MKRTTKYRLMSCILTGTIIISNWKELCIKALATSPEDIKDKSFTTSQHSNNDKLTVEEFLNSIENSQTKKMYSRLYELYDFETFNQRTEIPQYFQTIYGDKFSCGTIQSAGCGISSLAMISSYLFDENITPDMMTIYDNGPSPATALEKGIRRLNLNCQIHRGQSAIENIDLAVESGHPVIALMGNSSIFTNSGHFIVIAGKTKDNKYIVNDPNLENYYKKEMIDGYTNGFTLEEITKGLNGIYIFDTKKDFIDTRNSTLSLSTTNKKTNNNYNLDEILSDVSYIPKNDIAISTQETILYLSSNNTSIQIPKGIELAIIADTQSDYYIVKHNNEIGFIKKEHTLSLLDKANSLYPELQLSELKTKKIAYADRITDLRMGDSIEFDSIRTIYKYETINIIEEFKNWYFVMTNETEFGFIHKKHIKLITDKCVLVDKSNSIVTLLINGEKIYKTNGKDINMPKDGFYSLISKKRGLVLFDIPTGWNNVFSNPQYEKEKHTYYTMSKIQENIDKETPIIFHK